MAVNLLRPPQIIELENELKQLTDTLNGPWKHLIQDPGKVRRRVMDLEHQLEVGRPRKVTDPLERDRLAKMERELREEITHGMLSQEQMRKNAAGDRDRHMAWERAMKSRILSWKEARLRLAADDSPVETWNRDEANLEQFRPEGAVGRVRLDAQIPGKMAMSAEAKEHWPLGEPTATTATKHIRRPLTDAQRTAARERLAKARARKKLIAAAAQTA